MNEFDEIFCNHREKYVVSNHEFQRRVQISTLLNTEDFVFTICEPDDLSSFRIVVKRRGKEDCMASVAQFLVTQEKMVLVERDSDSDTTEALINRIRTVLINEVNTCIKK